jgi:hypothetical protein
MKMIDEPSAIRPLTNSLMLLLKEQSEGKTLFEKFFDNSLTDAEVLYYNSGLCVEFAERGNYFVGEYDDNQYVRSDAINNFIRYLGVMLSDSCLFQLTQRFLQAESQQCDGYSFLRNSCVAKALLNEEIRRYLKRNDEVALYGVFSYHFDSCIIKHISSKIARQGLIDIILAADIDKPTLHSILKKGDSQSWRHTDPLKELSNSTPLALKEGLQEIQSALDNRQGNNRKGQLEASGTLGDGSSNSSSRKRSDIDISGPTNFSMRAHSLDQFKKQGLQDPTLFVTPEVIFKYLLVTMQTPIYRAALQYQKDPFAVNSYDLFMECLRPMQRYLQDNNSPPLEVINCFVEQLKETLILLKEISEPRKSTYYSGFFGMIATNKFSPQQRMFSAFNEAMVAVKFAEAQLEDLGRENLVTMSTNAH